MIIKSMSRKAGISQLFTYLFKDEKKLLDKDSKPIVVRKNVRSRTLEKNIKEFEKNAASRECKRKDAVQVYHTVISFNAKDREQMNEMMLKDFARHYMDLKGKDGMYVAVTHFDRDHVHIHIAESGTKYLTGKANRISQQQFKDLKVAMQTYQKEKYPELKNSLPEHGKSSTKVYEGNQAHNTKKEELQIALKTAYGNAKNVNEFLGAIKDMGHEAYYRNEKLTGIKYDGDQKFRLSRLGYDKDKLEGLKEREKDQEQLDELQNIREDSNAQNRVLESGSRTMEEDVPDGEDENGR